MTQREIEAMVAAMTPGLESVAISLGCDGPAKILFVLGVKRALTDGLQAAKEAS